MSRIYLFIRKLCLTLQQKSNGLPFMEIKKITHEEALRRWKHSLEIKREWERKVAERWANANGRIAHRRKAIDNILLLLFYPTFFTLHNEVYPYSQS